MIPELSFQGQKIRSQADAEEKDKEHVTVGRHGRITVVTKLVKSLVSLWQKVCLG